MARTTCPECGGLVDIVPWISDDEIGQVPQFIAQHRVNRRAFVGKPCPGSRLPVKVWAVPEQRQQ